MVLVLEMKCVSLWEFLSLSTQSPHHLQKKILFWPWPRSFLSQTLKDSFVFTKPILGSKLERRYNPDRIVKKKKGPRDLGNENAEGEGGHAGKHICWMLGKLREGGGVGRISWKRIWTVSRKLEFEWEKAELGCAHELKLHQHHWRDEARQDCCSWPAQSQRCGAGEPVCTLSH